MVPSFTSEAEVYCAAPPGSFIEEFLLFVRSDTNAHPVLSIGNALALLSLAAPENMVVVKHGTHRPNFFTLNVAPSGRGKTTAIQKAQAVLNEALLDPKLEGWNPIGGNPLSANALRASFKDQKEQILFYDELGGFLQDTAGTATKNQASNIRAALTEVYDSDSVRLNSKSEGQVHVRNHRLSFVAGSNMTYLKENTDAIDWKSGFLARYFVGNVDESFYRSSEVWDHPKGAKPLPSGPIAQRLRALLVKKRNSDLKKGKALYSQCLGLSDGAEDVLAEMKADRARRARNAHTILDAAYARADQLILKIALLIAVDYGDIYGANWTLTDRELVPAYDIIQLHFNSLEQMVPYLTEQRSRDWNDVVRIREAIQRSGPYGLTEGELSVATQIPENQSRSTAMRTLKNMGVVVWDRDSKRYFSSGEDAHFAAPIFE